MSDLSILKRVGAVRAAEEGEKAQALTPEAKSVMALADMALGLAEKKISELEVKLDNYAEKKPLAGHSQDDAVGGDVETEGKDANKNTSRKASKAFLGLFNGGVE